MGFFKSSTLSSGLGTRILCDDNAIQVHISRLCEKIEQDPSSPQYIQTVWGIGYRLGFF